MPPATKDDRRAALKVRHRRAIVDAAKALMEGAEGTAFTVDQLARRADVSRRTVFNHFASLDDVVMEALGDVIGAVTESLAGGGPAGDSGEDPAGDPGPDGAGATLFREVAAGLRSTDLVTPMAHLTKVLGGEPGVVPLRRADLMSKVFTELSERLAARLLGRHPEADPLTVRLLVGSLTSGLLVLHVHWSEATGAADDPDSRLRWAELLERLIATLGTGFSADAPQKHTDRPAQHTSQKDNHG